MTTNKQIPKMPNNLKIRYLVIITTFLLLAPVSRVARAESTDAILTRVAQTQDVPEKLLKAICLVESDMNLQAFAEKDGGPGNHAFGACQVLLRTAEGMGFLDTGKRCTNWTPRQRAEYHVCGLFGPVTNFHFAAKYIKYQLKRYKGNWVSAIAAYNAGTAIIRRDGKDAGKFVNQEYVNKVLQQLEEISR